MHILAASTIGGAVITRVGRGTGLFSTELAAGAAAQFALLALLTAALNLGERGWLAGTAYAAGLWTTLAVAGHRSPTRALGPANRVTLARATLVGCVTALVADGISAGTRTAVLVALATVALILDAADGYVARRTGTASALGARFDMEVDAFLILVLSIFVAMSLGAWVLAIGAMRYAFVAAAWLMPWLRAPLRPSFVRKTVAAMQGTILTAASADIVPRLGAVVAVAMALALLVWSFGRDVVWLHENRANRGETQPIDDLR
ncbi:CDP-alcohol phosphatidyltransferase family protein [Saccharopolyspora sp. K220]|uniref:CDP-alcohol phosphatidyltransferase family protein n=1 Tax=Saccharopolyspora soli TaxID=2926618 RepID=UPI001F598A76|nr:CDP-alcohol phosphatidyltransferase family protein [Saccharopolyspora soli]MCI2416050.1 CDP-alcohol phosphatidyltransferase family protein [Saccharopolyspora soli]